MAVMAQECDIDTLPALSYATRNSEPLGLDLYRPLNRPGTSPIILAVSGGFWWEGRREEMRPLAEQLAARGFAVAAIECRQLPQAAFPDQLSDVQAAAAWLYDRGPAYHLSLTQLIALGVSSGGQLAALSALDPLQDGPHFSGLISISGPMDLTAATGSPTADAMLARYLGTDRSGQPERYTFTSPITHIGRFSPPCLLIHGATDPLVPFARADAMAAAQRRTGTPVILHPMQGPGLGLSSLASTPGWEMPFAIIAFLQHLPTRDAPPPDR